MTKNVSKKGISAALMALMALSASPAMAYAESPEAIESVDTSADTGISTTSERTWTYKFDYQYVQRATYIYNTCSTSSVKLYQAPVGLKVYRVAISNDGWTKVEYNGNTGYIKSSCLDLSLPIS